MKLIRPKTGTVGAGMAALALAFADGQRTLLAQLLEGTPGVTYSDQATVINITDVHNYPSPIVICDTGPLPSAGGFLEASVTEANVANGALVFELGHATCEGFGPKVQSATSLNNFFLEIMAMDGAHLVCGPARSDGRLHERDHRVLACGHHVRGHPAVTDGM